MYVYTYVSKDGGLFLDDKKTNLTGGARNTIANVDRRKAIVVAPVTPHRSPSLLCSSDPPIPPYIYKYDLPRTPGSGDFLSAVPSPATTCLYVGSITVNVLFDPRVKTENTRPIVDR